MKQKMMKNTMNSEMVSGVVSYWVALYSIFGVNRPLTNSTKYPSIGEAQKKISKKIKTSMDYLMNERRQGRFVPD